eukprot:CAMPEP_0117686852 /NCGR_PEP_ID=MMETSP0804-20121206/22743_1 /TAXON_ID=1074897 /ORGANISM="Tetraselmis astigmatica, Strain CCMP880" /LENGTH=153 /DNA_ID=CAMNT_0005498717 /DNA_START=69 /DNA_END=530 /DNA_ORIENTATION=-
MAASLSFASAPGLGLRSRALPARSSRRGRVVVRAESKPKFSAPEISVDTEQLQATLQSAKESVKETFSTAISNWETVEDKPTAVILGVAALFALYAGFSMISAIDKLPFLGGFFEIVGIGATTYFAYSVLASPEGRKEWLDNVEETVSKISLK